MKHTHTPGPWRIVKSFGHHIGPSVLAGGEVQDLVAMISYDGAPCGDSAETNANASLIAAAPDLLAALETLLEKAGSFEAGGMKFKHYFGEAVFNAHAAIAKAKG